MTNPRLGISDEHDTSSNKRKRIIVAVAQELVTSEDDDIGADGMDICDIIDNHTVHHRQTATSNALHALGETIRNTLLEINEIREQNRERRHKELLEVLTKMVQLESSNKTEVNLTKSTDLKETYAKTKTLNNLKQNSNESDLLESQQFPLETEQVVMNNSSSQDFFNNAKETYSKVANNQQASDSAINSCNTEVFDNNSNANFNDSVQPLRINKTPNKFIKLLPNSPVSSSNSQPLMIKTKNVSLKSTNTKEELQKMRAQMLELQRQKMEDRERKKRELLQMQNM